VPQLPNANRATDPVATRIRLQAAGRHG